MERLKRWMLLLCAATTGLILAIVLGVLLIVSELQADKREEIEFSGLMTRMLDELSGNGTIRDRTLADWEVQNRCLIHIRLNGSPLFFPGAYWTGQERYQLLEEAEKNITVKLPEVTERPSSFEMAAQGGSYRCGVVRTIARGTTWSLTLIKGRQPEIRFLWSQRALFLGGFLLGALGLYLVSRILVRRMTAPIEENQKKQTAFVAAASHELRSPLAVIQANAMSPVGDSSAEAIRRECGRLSRLVSDLLLLAGSDAKTWTLHTQPVDADTLLIETYEAFQPLAQNRGRRLKISLPDNPLPPLAGDNERLRQILTILLDNAISYTPQEGTIVLRGFPKGNGICFQVEDNGSGVPSEIRERIFERFYRADASRSDKSHMGLGLSIAQELATLHRGRLTLTETPGGGATFTVWVPQNPGK